MRHLTESAASGALRRGRGIEQFLEAFEEHRRRGLRYAYVSPAARFHGFIVSLYIVEDIEEPAGSPVDEFPAFYEADEDADGARTIAETDSAEAAITVAEREIGADPKRWVNQGILFDEYRDFVERGRPLGRWLPR
ncbi:hypothetical protein GCM10023196_075360 [Actinoallomurus vinaceus]|uniref:Uncharacterized protein n=1 Tax=Actinoallomurus vinaceus TaxID=1080074 RepID=A0ABP8UMQ4_9ACTN